MDAKVFIVSLPVKSKTLKFQEFVYLKNFNLKSLGGETPASFANGSLQ